MARSEHRNTTLTPPFSEWRARRSGRARRLWVAAALVVFAGGSAGVLVGANAWRGEAQSSNRAVVAQEAHEVATTLSGELQRYEDMTASVAVLLAPGTSTPVDAFAQSVNLGHRYPALEGIGYISDVTAAMLPTFLSQMRSGGGPYTVTPAGSRSEYCLGSAAQWLPAAAQEPTVPLLGFDFCSMPWLASALDTARRSGVEVIAPE